MSKHHGDHAQADAAGKVKRKMKRKAYERHGEWMDAVQFGLVREDLEEGEA